MSDSPGPMPSPSLDDMMEIGLFGPTSPNMDHPASPVGDTPASPSFTPYSPQAVFESSNPVSPNFTPGSPLAFPESPQYQPSSPQFTPESPKSSLLPIASPLYFSGEQGDGISSRITEQSPTGESSELLASQESGTSFENEQGVIQEFESSTGEVELEGMDQLLSETIPMSTQGFSPHSESPVLEEDVSLEQAASSPCNEEEVMNSSPESPAEGQAQNSLPSPPQSPLASPDQSPAHPVISPPISPPASPMDEGQALPIQDAPASPVEEYSQETGPQSPDPGPQSPDPGPQSPDPGPQSPDLSPKSNASHTESRLQQRSPPASPNSQSQQSPPGSPRSPSASQEYTENDPGDGPDSPPASPIAAASPGPKSPGSGPRSPDSSPQSPEAVASVVDAPASPGSAPGSPRSRSGSPRSVKSRSASRSPSVHGSRDISPGRSPARSRSGTPGSGRSRSRTPGSGRSRSGSRASVRSGSRKSGSRSPSSGRSRSRSGSPASRASGSKGSRSPSPVQIAGSGPISPGAASARSASPAPSEGSQHEDKEKGLIADIFGSSDSEEEFEGFQADEVEDDQQPRKRTAAILSDSEDEGATGQDTGGQILPDVSSDEDEGINKGKGDFVSDFDLMLQRRKEEMNRRRRKRRDVDIINDSDDLIADMISKMRLSAEADRESNKEKRPGMEKLKLMPYVMHQLKKADLHSAFLDCGILGAITEWLAPLPDKTLPNLQIRTNMLIKLKEFGNISSELLKSSGVGKAVMYLYKHPREIKNNKIVAGRLINEWARPIFNLQTNYYAISREEREQRDYEHLPKKRRVNLEGGMTPGHNIDKVLSQEDPSTKPLRPGDKGWVNRARVPMPSNKDYVVRPKWTVEEKPKGAVRKTMNRFEKKQREFKDKVSRSKSQRAVNISIEGRHMSL